MSANLARTLCRIALAAAFASVPTLAMGQPYPGVTPMPITTDPARMHALATDREIRVRISLGVAALRRNDDASAEQQFARALDLHPGEPQASTAAYDLGIALANRNHLDAAAHWFADAIARDRGFLAARANLVSVQLRRGDLQAARVAANDLVAIAPASARAVYARGLVALRSGDATTARADFGKLAAADPTYAVAHYDLALAEVDLAAYADAERELTLALDLSPSYVRARLALGAVLLREGKRDDARLAFDRAARTASDPQARNLAIALRDAIAR